MSTSRLEKFIYAICSMEVSDLPAPLSRIEILWNCLITGETPDFEPQSRNEQYLMAMLGLYELDQLPTPMNRGEKLLYKIAMGETDLSDVPAYLSRYEELLKYLIENGGIGNFEYVLYTLNQSLSTLYNTAEKPVKSAILKGNTLVNLSKTPSTFVTMNQSLTTINLNIVHNLQANKKYAVIGEISEINAPNKGLCTWVTHADGTEVFEMKRATNKGRFFFTYNATKKIKTFRVYVHGEDRDNGGTITIGNLMIIEYQEGMENWDIPYFTGMQSVKLPVLTTSNGGNVINNDMWMIGRLDSTTGDVLSGNQMITDFIKKPYNVVEFSTIGGSVYNAIFEYDANKNFIKATGRATNNLVLTLASNTEFIKLNVQNPIESLETHQPMLTSGGRNELKTNILSTSEDVELRGVSDVKDTLDCLTGEVTQRIGEVVLDGSERWVYEPTYTNDNVYGCYIGFEQLPQKPKPGNFNFANNVFPNITNSSYQSEGFATNPSVLSLRIAKGKLESTDLSGFKKYLQNHPVTLQYPLATESIKTVDLTTIDQDGQPTKLKTFNDISHVEINADNIIPSVDVEVATKISETLSTMGLQHHELSETQNKLGQTIEEQAENTDAAMLATTEIYEQTL